MVLKVSKSSNIHSLLAEVNLYFNSFNMQKIKKMEATTLLSELIYNIQKHTPEGSLTISVKNDILEVHAQDKGTGIDDFTVAIKDGYSTSGTLGLGFASIFRLSDEVDIETSDSGTTISIKKSIL